MFHRTKLFRSVQLDNSESLWRRTAIEESLSSKFGKIEVNLFVPICSICTETSRFRKVSFSGFQDLAHEFDLAVWDNVIEFAEIALDGLLED